MPAKLPRLALAADILAGVLLVVASITVFVEGPSLWIGETRILSLRSAWRTFLWAAVILAIRAWYVPRPRSFEEIRRAIGARIHLDDTDHAGSTPRSVGTFRELTLSTLGYVLLVVALTWPQVARFDSVPDVGDPLFSIWRIAWVSHQIVRDPLSLFDTNIFHPERLTLTYSDPVIVPGLMAAPFLWAGGHPLYVYNLLLLSGFVLSGLTTHALVRYLTGRPEAAFVAGTVFAVYPHRLEHYPHLELQMTMCMPLVLLGIHRTLASLRLRDGILTGFAFIGQALSSLYYGVFTAIYAVPFGLILWFSHGRPWRAIRALAAGALVAAVIITPVAIKYSESRQQLGDRAPEVVGFYSATVGDYLQPHDRNWLYTSWISDPHPERQLFPRLTPLVLTVVALWPPWTPVRLAYAAGLFVAFDGSRGMNGESYPWLYAALSAVRGLRVPARFSVLVGLTLAVFTGFALSRLMTRWPRRRLLVAGSVLAMVAIEAIPAITLERVWLQPPPIYDAIPPTGSVIAEFPMATEEFGSHYDTRYLYFSAFHWRTMVNGNSGHFPPSHATLIAHMRDFPSTESLEYLRQRHVTHITVHGAFYGEGRYRTIINALDGRSDLELVTAAPWEGSESRAYRLRQ